MKSLSADYESGCTRVVKAVRSGDFKAARDEMKTISKVSDAIVVSYAAAARIKEAVAKQSNEETDDIY